MKQIRFTVHSLERIAARNIALKIVENVIKTPQQVFPDEDDAKRMVSQSIVTSVQNREMLVRVFSEETKDEIVVMTAYASSQIEKYWRK